MADSSPLKILPDAQLLAILDAFATASMETSVSEEGLTCWYAMLEEVARRDLMRPEDRADEADWIVAHLFPDLHRRIVVDSVPLSPHLPRVTVNFVDRP